eukprot:gene10240-2660_t
MNQDTPVNKTPPLTHRIAVFFDRLNQREHGYSAINVCLKCVALMFMIYFIMLPIAYINTCASPIMCVLVYFLGPLCWVCVSLQITGSLLYNLHPIPSLVLNLMSSVGFFILSVVIFSLSFTPPNFFMFLSSALSFIVAIYCIFLSFFDTADLFRFWVKGAVYGEEIAEEPQYTKVSLHELHDYEVGDDDENQNKVGLLSEE